MGKDIVPVSTDYTRDLIKQIAMDIGKEVVSHIEIMYPQMFENVASTAKLSIRNCVHNQIMAALEISDEGKIIARLQERARFRKRQRAIWKKIRAATNTATTGTEGE